MTRRLAVVFARSCAASAFAAGVFMLATTGAVAAPPEADDSRKEMKICRTEKMTGSLTRSRRICATQREWAEAATNTASALNRTSRSANSAEALLHNPSAAASALSGT